MPARDTGDIISPRQSRSRWHRGAGLAIRTAGGDEEAWLVHLAYALRWSNAALGALTAGWTADWTNDEYRQRHLAIIVAGAGGYVGLAADLVPPSMDADLRRELLGPDVEDLVLGYSERSGEWVPGYAGLTERDAEAFRFALGLRSEECRRPDREHRGGLRCLFEIRDLCDRRQKGRRKGMPLAIETIERRLVAARRGLRDWADQVRAELGSGR